MFVVIVKFYANHAQNIHFSPNTFFVTDLEKIKKLHVILGLAETREVIDTGMRRKSFLNFPDAVRMFLKELIV